eukprot:jgi/Botrbrau1/737/Bobra.160_2s0060.1
MNETSAELAAEAAKADAVVRAARKASILHLQLRELERLKAENEALQNLVLEVAPDKNKAADQVNQLKERCKHLISSVAMDVGDAALTPAVAPSELETDGLNETEVKLLMQLAAAAASLQEAEVAAAKKKEADSSLETGVAPEAEGVAGSPPVEEQGSPSMEDDLVRLAEAATAASSRTFCFPPRGLTPGVPGKLFYNVSGGPLNQGARPRLKAGLNKWEEILQLEASRQKALRGLPNQNWWSIQLDLPEDTFLVDWVMEDCNSSSVDNNGGRDFVLMLYDAPSEEDVLMARARSVTEFERQRAQLLEDAEAAQWEIDMLKAQEEAADAKIAFRQEREAQIRARAAADAAARLNPPPNAASCEDGRPGLFCWLSEDRWELLENSPATFFYNAAGGPLRVRKMWQLHSDETDGWSSRL